MQPSECNTELRQAYSDYMDGLITAKEYFKKVANIGLKYLQASERITG